MKNSNLLLKVRKEIGLSQSEMATKLGYNKKYIYQVESGNTEISANILERLLTLEDISNELKNDIKNKLKDKKPSSTKKRQKKVDVKSNEYHYLIKLIIERDKEILQLKEEIDYLKFSKSFTHKNKAFEKKLKAEAFLKDSTNISLIIDRMWKLRDENMKYFSELEVLLSINNHQENLKLKKGLKTVALSLQEQSNKILSYLDEKVIEIESD